MNRVLKIAGVIIVLLTFSTSLVRSAALPAWFIKSFNEQKLNLEYKVVQTVKPDFLQADFNGDTKDDIAVQIVDTKTNKKGILIINQGQDKYYVFGAGKKFDSEKFDNTNWLNGWRVYKNKTAYETLFKPDGDIISSKKFALKCFAVYIFQSEDGDEVAGQLIYWDGTKYISIHQGE